MKRELRDTSISKRVGKNVRSAAPKISVIIPAYKNAEHIAECVTSALDQKFREHEIILINDGSPDSAEMESAIRRELEYVTYIKQKNLGAGPARNTGLLNARGAIAAFLDADDAWLPDYLASQYVYLERHALDMVYCDAVMFGINSAYKRRFMDTAPSEGGVTVESLLELKCNVITSGTMARMKAVIDAGMFETERVRAHDFHLWLRMAKSGARIGYQREPLVRYRVRLESLSGDAVSRVERERDAFERVRRTIELTEDQNEIIKRQIEGLEADLQVEIGKSLLLSGDHSKAASAFAEANRRRRSLKLTLVTALSRLAPGLLLDLYQRRHAPEIVFVPKNKRA